MASTFFAFLRTYVTEEPSEYQFLAMVPIIYLISYLTWKYIETPFRNKSLISRKQVFSYSTLGSAAFIIYGVFLNFNYGDTSRVNDPSFVQKDMDKRIYNERAFKYEAEKFTSENKVKLLIIGNSFARDFVNITTETFNTINHEIIYRSDLKQCIIAQKDNLSTDLYSTADIIVFSSGIVNYNCLDNDILYAKENNKSIFYVGTKNFGYNLNWVIRIDRNDRSNLYNTIDNSVINTEMKMDSLVPKNNYISLLKPTLDGNKIPITDESGRMLSTDRVHLTKYGAIYFGKKAVISSPYSESFR